MFLSYSTLVIIRERKFLPRKLVCIINSVLYKLNLHEIIARLLTRRTRELKPSEFDDDRVKRQLNRTDLRAARRCRRRRWWWSEKWVSRENGRTVIHSTWHKRGESEVINCARARHRRNGRTTSCNKFAWRKRIPWRGSAGLDSVLESTESSDLRLTCKFETNHGSHAYNYEH